MAHHMLRIRKNVPCIEIKLQHLLYVDYNVLNDQNKMETYYHASTFIRGPCENNYKNPHTKEEYIVFVKFFDLLFLTVL